ncbi:2-hydroxychromene-2-carboxylate isomerase [Eleftheria terrae]|uniref:2-hydroxychromene-2-carboxylate isomerase n=1 Tax=Eleftheria terrae TaxID=1597781 RepID=UPI00263A8CCA|nr:2-hydroxychromene-2-carboxylate isomerase [Eleftheria terrae]WKB51063.1 2-hydroxychromene-2-carboxylate isomerase [Eleftheria terrae]
MSLTVDYYFAPQSPYAYLGHQRLWDLVRETGAQVRVLPVDLGGRVFPVSGGLPLSKRAPQRQAYRLIELRRWSDYLGLPMNVEPRYFPVNSDEAARLIAAVEMKDGSEAAMTIAGAVQRAVWAEELNIADEAVLLMLLERHGLPAQQRLDDSHSQAAHERYEANTEQAIRAGVFGAPSYVVEGELFWGQDRLDFVERRLRQAAAAAR